MDNVVQVAANTSPPPLPQSGTERRSVRSPISPNIPDTRQLRPRRQYNRILDQDGAVVGSDDAGYSESPSPRIPGDDGKPGLWREEGGDKAEEIEHSPMEDYDHVKRLRPVLMSEDEEHLKDPESVHGSRDVEE